MSCSSSCFPAGAWPHPGREILQAVWDYDYTGETRTVDMHVKALRQKLGEDIITTVRGVGYKMV
ncbi:MAG: winged helix-turn-helix domain-containing protein [Flavonifractor plautii]